MTKIIARLKKTSSAFMRSSFKLAFILCMVSILYFFQNIRNSNPILFKFYVLSALEGKNQIDKVNKSSFYFGERRILQVRFTNNTCFISGGSEFDYKEIKDPNTMLKSSLFSFITNLATTHIQSIGFKGTNEIHVSPSSLKI